MLTDTPIIPDGGITLQVPYTLGDITRAIRILDRDISKAAERVGLFEMCATMGNDKELLTVPHVKAEIGRLAELRSARSAWIELLLSRTPRRSGTGRGARP